MSPEAVLLGIDAGSTVTKSVAFDTRGRVLAHASARVPQLFPAPHQVERDVETIWATVVDTVRQVLAELQRTGAGEVTAIGVTSHGDGIYLLDATGAPTRPGIMSLDTRARQQSTGWHDDGTADAAQLLTGQRPWASAPATLLAWLQRHEPEVLARTRWALPCKDVIRHRLTGEFLTEPTEASTSFTNVQTQGYDDAVLSLYGLTDLQALLPPVVGCAEIGGRVSAAAADATGLKPGIPVAGSAHDVDASAIGAGVRDPGVAAVIAGSFNINEVVSLSPTTDDRWITRNFVEPGRWLNMSLSPTSSTNLEWFTRQLCAADLAAGAAAGDPFGFMETEIAAIADDPREVVFLPFLYGSQYPHDASASLLGVRGWHTRGHLLRAVLEGITFTHRHHVDLLADGLGVESVRLTGGASRSPRWSQLFADVLDLPVEVSDCTETGALGVAQLAGVASGVYAHLPEAISATVRVERRHEPGPDVEPLAVGYRRYQQAIEALRPFWLSAHL